MTQKREKARIWRSTAREMLFRWLFIAEFNPKEDMPRQFELYFKGVGSGIKPFDGDEEPDEEELAPIREKYESIAEKNAEIDALLNETSKGWKTSRMSTVDLCILRLAVYEILYDEDMPVGVAINEAVELAKRFGGEDSGSFVNGILGKIAKSGKE